MSNAGQQRSDEQGRACQAGRAIVWGMAHAFDLGAGLARYRGRFAGGPAADAAALRSDWQKAIRWADGHAQRP